LRPQVGKFFRRTLKSKVTGEAIGVTLDCFVQSFGGHARENRAASASKITFWP